MTMLNTTRYAGSAPTVQRAAAVFLARCGRLIKRWIAAAIAHRERKAGLAALQNLSDRDLADIGLCRGEISDALAERAQARLGMQLSRRS